MVRTLRRHKVVVFVPSPCGEGCPSKFSIRGSNRPPGGWCGTPHWRTERRCFAASATLSATPTRRPEVGNHELVDGLVLLCEVKFCHGGHGVYR